MRSSIILNPVDSISLFYDDQDVTRFLHGLYISDKIKTEEEKRASVIQFAGRGRATYDINRIYKSFAISLGAAESSLRLLSGLHAHIAVFMSLAGVGDSVLLLPEIAGGHFSTKGILQRLGLNVIDMAVDFKSLCINREATLRIAEAEKPDFLFVDRSEGLRYEDFSFLSSLKGPVKIFDASQYLPQIMTSRYVNPFEWGFDLLVFTVHKSFPGPQKAGVATRQSNDMWLTLQRGLGELVSSAHTESSYHAGLVLTRDEQLEQYTAHLLETAVALEDNLRCFGVPVFDRTSQGPQEWPPTQHVWLPLGSRENAFLLYQELSKVRIYTNYRLLPYGLGWGIRMGTAAASVRGMRTDEAREVAQIIADVFKNGASLAVRHRVRALAKQMEPQSMTTWPLRPVR